MNFDVLLEPYKEGGVKNRPVERTMSTILDYLLNKKQYPMEIVGGAIFLVFNWLNSGGKFRGDGKYGSAGKELVTSIRIKCDDLLYQRLEGETHKTFVELYAKDLKMCITPNWQRKFLKWWRGKDEFTFRN